MPDIPEKGNNPIPADWEKCPPEEAEELLFVDGTTQLVRRRDKFLVDTLGGDSYTPALLTRYGIRQALNINSGTILVALLMHKLGIRNEFKVSVFMGVDNAWSLLWLLMGARLFAADDGSTSMIGLNLSNSVELPTLLTAAEVRRGLAVFKHPKLGSIAALFQFSAWVLQWLSCWVLLEAMSIHDAGPGAAAACGRRVPRHPARWPQPQPVERRSGGAAGSGAPGGWTGAAAAVRARQPLPRQRRWR